MRYDNGRWRFFKYTCLLWDADMRYDNGRWRFFKFNGQTKWVEQLPTSETRQEPIIFLLNE